MRRGDVVLVALKGDYGKPRPAVVVQADDFMAHSSVVVLPCTTQLHEWPGIRVRIEPDDDNGLIALSEVMIDKPHPYAQERINGRIGRLSSTDMGAVNRALATFLGFG